MKILKLLKYVYLLVATLGILSILYFSPLRSRKARLESLNDTPLAQSLAAVKPVTSLQLIKKINSSKATVKIINIWATWCGPCKEELPNILKLFKKYKAKGLEVYFVSADSFDLLPEVKIFLKSHKVNFMTFIKHEDDTQFMSALFPQWSGTLPTSIIYDKSGAPVQFWQREASFKQFENEILKLL